MKPQFEALAVKYEGKLKVGGMNTLTGNMRFAISQGVMGLPTIHLFQGGERIFAVSGAVDFQELEKQIDSVVG